MNINIYIVYYRLSFYIHQHHPPFTRIHFISSGVSLLSFCAFNRIEDKAEDEEEVYCNFTAGHLITRM